MTIKVIGAGFGRTGTTSLQAALEELGFSRCYHMQEVYKRPADALIWSKALRGGPVDWDQLFTGYQATVDWPGCTFYRELMKKYPDAKIILSVRDPEKWYESSAKTIFRIIQVIPPWLFWLRPGMRHTVEMIDNLVWQGTFHGHFAEKSYAINIFQQHIDEVKRVVPAERLLVFDVREGWGPLCRFLGVSAPNKPFPHLNDTAQFQRMIRILQLAGIAPYVVAAVVGVVTLWWRSPKRYGSSLLPASKAV